MTADLKLDLCKFIESLSRILCKLMYGDSPGEWEWAWMRLYHSMIAASPPSMLAGCHAFLPPLSVIFHPPE